MVHKFSRTQLLIGEAGLKKLAQSQVAVFGVGGVGSYTAEALARAGVGKLILVDHDTIALTNINRQLHALHSTVDKVKVEVMKERILDINPDAVVDAYQQFLDQDNYINLIKKEYSYIVDAIDTVAAKLLLIQRAIELKVPVVSSMGAGNKLVADQFQIADISETKICPLAKVMRRELRKNGIPNGVKVVYSPAEPISPAKELENYQENVSKRQIPGSISFVPAVAGLLLAGEVINCLLEEKK